MRRARLICRILAGQFPNYERVIPRNNDKKAVFDRRRLDAAVGRVALLSGGRPVKFRLTSQLLVISTQSPELGDAREEVACDYAGGELQLAINPNYLRDFLSARHRRDPPRDEGREYRIRRLPEGDAAGHYMCVMMPARL